MRLIDAIESISEGFILFDSDERLVICNDKYREQFSVVADVLVPGVALEDLLRAAAARGQVAENADGVKAWVRNRLAQYRKGKGTIEQQLGDGRWVLATERRTRDGGIVGIRTDITEIKRAEEALRASEARIANAYRLARITYRERSTDTKTISYWPDAYVETSGVPFAEAPNTYEAFYPFIHPDDRERIRECYERADAEGSDFAIEYRLLHTNGAVRYIHELGKAVFDDGGRFTGHTGTNQDITDLREREIALRESEARLINAQRIAKLGDWEFDIATGEMRWSDEACRIFGVPPEDPEPRRDRFRRSVNPGDLALVKAADQRAIEGDGHTSVDFRITLPGGEIRYIHSEGEVTFDDAGTAIRVTGTNQDITDRKRAEDALRESEERYRELFDESPVGIWEEDWSAVKRMVDRLAQRGIKNWRNYLKKNPRKFEEIYELIPITNVSRAILGLYGAPDVAALNEMFTASSTPEDDIAVRETLIAFIEGKMVYEYVARERKYDGTEIITHNQLVVPPDHRDDWSRVIYAIEDITDRKRAEDALSSPLTKSSLDEVGMV